MNLLAGAKTQSNPESCVGVLQLAGKTPKMLVTPTPDLGKVLNSMHAVQMAGHVNLATGVQARWAGRKGLFACDSRLTRSGARLAPRRARLRCWR